MKNRFHLWTLCLVAVMTVSACAPAVTVTNVPTEASVPQVLLPTATLQPTLVQPTIASAETIAAPTQPVEVQPVATSRGPDLEATDPMTVALASGSLQLVEFFRFT